MKVRTLCETAEGEWAVKEDEVGRVTVTSACLFEQQIANAKTPEGQLDIDVLKALVEAAYDEKELERANADRLAAEEVKQVLADLELQNLRFKAALDNMAQGLALFDSAGQLVVSNFKYAELIGLPQDDSCIGLQLFEVLERSTMLGEPEQVERRLLSVEYEVLNKTRGGSAEQVWPDGRTISIVRRPVDDGGFLDTVADITETRQATAQIAHLARHDALTDLPNRLLLRERLAEAIAAANSNHTAAVLCLDLDRFKGVNDTLGHPMGDALLVAVSRRLRSVVRDGDLVARLGGDEFAVIQHLLPSAAEPEALARRIVSVLSQPYDIEGQLVQIGVSIGIERIRDAQQNADEVLRNADLALYRAKEEGRGGYRVFEPSMHAQASHKRQLEIDLRIALESRQFEVHYQSQIDLKTGEIEAFEALARWRHPKRGMVSPLEFIVLSEELGLIDRLGAYVLETACVDAMRWPKPVRVAVNLSATQFKSGKLVSIVEGALRRSGLEARRLELEITEGVLLAETTSTISQLRYLKQLGIHISLDDFGTGYSALSYIRSFPFDRIKIDQTFVRELGARADSLAIIRAVAGMCGSLGIATTAEGVETDDQLLIAEKCDSVQGFLFGRPVPAAETLALFERGPHGCAA
jgi:diguanylate cyclase (GGDEF)-like protein